MVVKTQEPSAMALSSLIDSVDMPLGVLLWRADGSLLHCNPRAREILGRTVLLESSLSGFVDEVRLRRTGSFELCRPELLVPAEVFRGETVRLDDLEAELPDGRRRALEGWVAPVRSTDSAVGLALMALDDVTEQRRTTALHAAETRVLEMVNADAPLGQTLETLARLFEAQADGMLASVLLVEDGKTVRHAAAPSLPARWAELVDGEPIGPNRGSCGTAAYLKKPVIVSDIADDPRWELYRDAALQFGFRACWSTPIIGSDGEVLGTFAFYYSEPREPTERLLALATHASSLATLVIQRHRQEQALRDGEERARLIVENALDANVQIDSQGIITAWSPRAAAIFGWETHEAKGRRLSELIIPEPLRKQHEQGLKRYVATGTGAMVNKRIELRALRKNGHEFPVVLAVTPIRQRGEVSFSAFIQDVTASRRAEEQLRESQEQLSMLHEHSADALFHLRVEGDAFRFVSINPAFIRITGVPAEHIVGKLVEDVIPKPSSDLVLERYAEAIRTATTVRWEETSEYPTGTRYGDVAITPVFDARGQAKYLIGSVRDITEQRRMTGELSRLHERQQLDTVLESAPAAVVIARDGVVRYANPKTAEMLGLKVGDDPASRYVHSEDRQRILSEIAAGHSLSDVELQGYAADGRIIDVLATFRFIEYEGKPSVLAYLVDITNLKSAERRLKQLSERLQMATKGANIGIWTWDVEAGSIEWDEVMHRLYNVEQGAFLPTYTAWKASVHPGDLAHVEAAIGAALKGEGEFDPEFRILWPDGTERYVKANAMVRRDPSGRAVQMVGTNWDITDGKRAEDALRAAKDAAEAANRAKSAFLANMSHEIRTPMNAILGFGQLMARDELSSENRGRLNKILTSGDHLLELINNVLQMSKIEAGRMHLNVASFDLHLAISDVEAMVRVRIEQKQLTLRVEGVESLPRFVRSDAAKLRQVLLNLLGTATKFTKRGGVTLRVAAYPRNSHVELRFEVADTGVGIAQDELDKVFQPFEQTQSGVHAQTGTGLGVSISRDIVRLMGGDLSVRSTYGAGTTCEFTVRVEAASKEEVAPGFDRRRVIALAEGQAQPTILVVDDKVDNRTVLHDLLLGIGIEVHEAEDGLQAVERFCELEPDLVFMDVKMPVMDGIEATRRIRAAEGGARVPIVMVGASVFDDDRAEVLRTGGNEFIAKPFREAEIWSALERHLGLRLVRDSIRTEVPVSRAPVSRRDVAALGAEVVRALREATETGYVDRVPEILSGVGSEHERTVEALTKLSDDVEIERLLELL